MYVGMMKRVICLLTLVPLLVLVLLGCHTRRSRIQYPATWPLPQVTAPINSIPAQMVNPLGKNPYTIDHLPANNGQCIIYGIGFSNDIGWDAIVEDFKGKVEKLDYKKYSDDTETRMEYISSDRKIYVMLIRTQANISTATILIKIYNKPLN